MRIEIEVPAGTSRLPEGAEPEPDEPEPLEEDLCDDPLPDGGLFSGRGISVRRGVKGLG